MSTDRRSFLTRLGAGVTVAGGALASGVSVASAQSSSAGFSPAKHTQDDWMDRIPGKHRLVFDTTTPAGFGAALLYANNYLISSASGYGLKDQDTAIIIVARHFATPFAYNDAMWAKYGKQFSEQSGFVDPKTNTPPTANLYLARMDELVKKGVQFGVCQMSSRRIAGMIAQATGGEAGGILKELAANLVANARIVPAGIVAVNRAQERGYAFVYAG